MRKFLMAEDALIYKYEKKLENIVGGDYCDLYRAGTVRLGGQLTLEQLEKIVEILKEYKNELQSLQHLPGSPLDG